MPAYGFSGIGVSAGIVIGTALVWNNAIAATPVSDKKLSAEQVAKEILHFQQALEKSRSQIEALKSRLTAGVANNKDVEVFDSHLMLLADPALCDEISNQILTQRSNAEYAVHQIADQYCHLLEKQENAYLRSRTDDIRDVARRLIANLKEEELPDLTSLDSPRVVVARDLAPSDTAGLDRNKVLGFITAVGSRTSHTAIMARSLAIPAVVGVGKEIERIHSGDLVIMDGARGRVVVRPSEEQLAEYRERISQETRWFELVKAESDLPSETIDGFHVQLAANLELPEEIPEIKSTYGVGIGLFRTEFLFIKKGAIPSEQEQFEVYRRTVEEIYPRSVIFRTLDIGGDKFISGFPMAEELNPFLGVRAIRFSLARQEIFMCQLRAILRASAYGKARIMFPMISTVEEVRAARSLLEAAKRQLDAERLPYNANLDVGIMIEVPSAALLADKLAPLVDFFSLGTNDLVQYSMAVDRVNPSLAYLYQPGNPALIRLMWQVANTAHAHGKWVGICGETASDPLMLPLILGCGIQELSMSPVALGRIKRLVRRIRMHEAEALVQQAMKCSTATEVMDLCRVHIRAIDADQIGE
jgi:phosphotransferase system enzyme I (PtsI)